MLKLEGQLNASQQMCRSYFQRLELAKKGQSRQDAYRLIQAHAMATWDQGGHLYDRLSDDLEIQKLLKPEELTQCFDLDEQLRHVDAIFERVLAQRGESA